MGRAKETTGKVDVLLKEPTKPRPAGASRASRTRALETPRRAARSKRPTAPAAKDEQVVARHVEPTRVTQNVVLLTFKEAMDFLRVSRSTIYRLMWSGQLRGHKVGSTWRFYESDLLRAVASPMDSASPSHPAKTGEGRI